MTRLARATGKDAEVLNQEAELIEQWLEAQHEMAKQALDILNSIPGIQIEDCFNQAYDALMCRRVDQYATKPFLFEDTEQLGRSMLRYARMLVSPYRAQCDYLAAKARLSEFDGEAPTAESALAARQAQRAKHMISKRVMKLREWRIDDARRSLNGKTRALLRSFSDKPASAVMDTSVEKGAQAAAENRDMQLRPPKPRF